MKKLSFLLATFGLAAATLTGGATALAGSTCDIGFTGPDSKNICTATTEYTCKVINNNKIEFYNSNNQVAASGDATVSGNTTGGTATSGTATNSNGTTFNATVTNGDVCTAVVTKPANVTPETPAPTPGAGAVTPQQTVQPQATATVTPGRGQAVTPAVLPNTSSASPVAATMVIATIAGGLLAAARFALLHRQ